jgi:glycerate kinase
MKTLVLANALKGSLKAKEICQILNKFEGFTISDGGDGFLDSVLQVYPQAQKIFIRIPNAILKTKKIPFLLVDKIAFIESAQVCPMANLKKEELNILSASSIGLGLTIKEAINAGAKQIYIGLGGVASSEGAADAAKVFGWQFLDKENNTLELGAKSLLNLAKIKKPKKNLLKNIKITAVCDVKNILLGKQGSAKVYGKQKGAGPKEILILEKALSNYAKTVKKDLKININTKYCASAGAIASGLKAFFKAKLIDGSKYISKLLDLEKRIKNSDLIITTEGSLDKQTFFGKAPFEICHLAKKYKKPIIFICGQNKLKNKKILKEKNITKIIELRKYAKNIPQSILEAKTILKKVAKEELGNL